MNHTDHAADATEFPRAIGRPAAGALVNAGLTTWEALAAQSRASVAQLHGVGPKALAVLDEGLAQRGAGWAQP